MFVFCFFGGEDNATPCPSDYQKAERHSLRSTRPNKGTKQRSSGSQNFQNRACLKYSKNHFSHDRVFNLLFSVLKSPIPEYIIKVSRSSRGLGLL